ADRAAQIIGDVEHVLGEIGRGVLARILAVALGAATLILALRQGAQQLVLGVGQLGLFLAEQARELGGRGFGRALRSVHGVAVRRQIVSAVLGHSALLFLAQHAA